MNTIRKRLAMLLCIVMLATNVCPAFAEATPDEAIYASQEVTESIAAETSVIPVLSETDAVTPADSTETETEVPSIAENNTENSIPDDADSAEAFEASEEPENPSDSLPSDGETSAENPDNSSDIVLPDEAVPSEPEFSAEENDIPTDLPTDEPPTDDADTFSAEWPVDVGETCTHPNKQDDTTYRTIEGEDWKSDNDKTHSRLADLYDHWYCPDCRESHDTLRETNVFQTESHYFENGICKACSMVNACQHTKTERGTSYHYIGAPYTDNHDGTHSTQFDLNDYVHCLVCDEWQYTLREENATVTDPHSFHDGVCINCKAQNTCQHQNVNYSTSYDNINGESWHDNGDGTHSRKANLVQIRGCFDCGEQTDELLESGVIQTEKHSFENGSCISCGLKNSCTHTETVSGTTYWDIGDCAVDNHDGTHSTKYDLYDYVRCLLCGETHSYTLRESNVTLTEEHSFSNGVCYNCKAPNTCQHPNRETRSEYRRIQGEQWHDNGNGTHSRKADLYSYWHCPQCYEEFDFALSEPNVTQTDSHYFENGKCTYCMVENVCKHERTTETLFMDYSNDWVDNGNGTHSCNITIHSTIRCADCREWMGETLIQSNLPYTEEHYAPSNGKCHVCNAKTTCTHPNKYSEDFQHSDDLDKAEFTDNGDGTHSYLATYYRTWFCSDCYENLGISETIRSDVPQTEPHDFSNGFCEWCGSKNTCTHAHTSSLSEMTFKHDYKYLDANRHSYMGYLETWSTCDDCGVYLSSSAEKQPSSADEAHYYLKSGYCICGAKKPAPASTPTPSTGNTRIEADNYFTTPEPTEEPMTEPFPDSDAAVEAVEAILTEIETIQQEAAEITIEVVGAQDVLTESEMAQLATLPVKEQILVSLASMGFSDAVSSAMTLMNVSLCADAEKLIEQIGTRITSFSTEEMTAYHRLLSALFPLKTLTVNGQTHTFYVLTVRLTADGAQRDMHYGFRMDETGEWLVVLLENVL